MSEVIEQGQYAAIQRKKAPLLPNNQAKLSGLGSRYGVNVLNRNLAVATKPHSELIQEHPLISRGVVLDTHNPNDNLPIIALSNLRFSNVDHAFKDMVHSSNSCPIRQHDVVFLATVDRLDQSP